MSKERLYVLHRRHWNISTCIMQGATEKGAYTRTCLLGGRGRGWGPGGVLLYRVSCIAIEYCCVRRSHFARTPFKHALVAPSLAAKSRPHWPLVPHWAPISLLDLAETRKTRPSISSPPKEKLQIFSKSLVPLNFLFCKRFRTCLVLVVSNGIFQKPLR
jgi:hypothetical protein